MATTPSAPTSAKTSHPSPADTSVEAQIVTPSSVESANASTGASSLAAATTRAATDNPPLLASKRVAKRKAAPVDIGKAKSKKKKLVRKGSSRPSPTSKSSSSGGSTSGKAQKSTLNTVQQDASTCSSVTRAGPEFNLSDFMSSFQPGLVEGGVRALDNTVAASPLVPPHENDQDELAQLQQEITSLRGQVEGGRNSLRVLTNPNDQGELPAQSILQLTCNSFADQEKKAKGDYQPPQAHALAASRMFKGLLRQKTSPAILMALFSGRLGSRGLTILHFREESEDDLLEAGLSNCNFAYDFSSSATLPKAQPFCRSYNDILDGIHGLSRMGEELWHRHMLDLTDRLRIFVSKNKSADSASLPARVKLVLQYVSKWLGAALGHLQDDDPVWWNKFSRALSSIDFNSPEWTMALVNTLSLASSDHQRSWFKESCDYNRGRYEEKAHPRKEKGVPENIRAMIPVNRYGEEPCLRYLGEVMCSGGTRDRCGHPKRIHDWPSKNIPRRLRE